MQTSDTFQTGVSVDYCDDALVNQLRTLNPTSIVDFGAGNGKNSHLIHKAGLGSVSVKAVEGFKDTVDKLRSLALYDSVDYALIQDWIVSEESTYDLAIFGDVLEHLTPRQISFVMKQCVRKFRHIIIICPLHDIFQEYYVGNPLERHRTYVTESFFDRYPVVEKHIVRRGYTIMNILIDCQRDEGRGMLTLITAGFQRSILFFQFLGLGFQFVQFVKFFTKRCPWLFNRTRKEVIKHMN